MFRKFHARGYENSNENKYPNVEQDQTMNPDPEDNSKFKNQHFSNYDDMYRNLDQETVEYSDSKLAKGKKVDRIAVRKIITTMTTKTTT